MHKIYVWDPLVRVFHWLLAAGFVANALITDPESALHHWIGYALALLVGLRIIWGLIGSHHARFANFRPDPQAALGQLTDIATRRTRHHRGHSPLGALMIYNLLLTVLGIAFTGWLLTLAQFGNVGWPEDLHEALVTWAEVSILLHVAAVLFESHRTKVNLARSMITGYKELPETDTDPEQCP